MSEVRERYSRVAAGLTERVEAVPEGAWANPSPCEGWVARDVVGHLVDWVPAFLRSYAGIELPAGPSVDEDPAGAWSALRSSVQATLQDPDVAARRFDSPAGRISVEDAVDQLITADVLVHTWDLARAVGLDEALDQEAVRRLVEGMEPHDAALRASGHYGPRVEVGDGADEQTRLLAFLGRRP